MLPRSGNGVVPGNTCIRIHGRGPCSELSYETTISTIEDSPGTAARVPRSQLQQERARGPAQPPSGWTEALDPSLGHRPMGARDSQRLSFGRAARLKSGRDFARVRRVGERLAVGCLIANWQRLSAASASRLGVITAGKIGGAVVRSRARRLMRESFRLHQLELAEPVDLVLVARPSIVGKGFAEVERDYLTALRRARLLKLAGSRTA